MSAKQSNANRSWWKVLPGIAVSAFFLWRTLRGIHYSTFREMHFVAPLWIAIGLGFLCVGYTTRIYRWWVMLQSSGRASFGASGRVLLTSFAANNVLPFRIGDFLRVFAYAGDLNSSSSSILSTVILERLLDVCTLLFLLAAALLGGANGLPTFHVFGRNLDTLHFVEPLLAIVTVAVILMLFCARLLQRLLQRLMKMLPAGGFVTKLENWLLMAFEAVIKMPIGAKLVLLVTSLVAWLCEGMIFVSAARLLGLESGPRGPWLALSLSNLSYLIPSSPGAIGTFEYFSKLGMTSQGAQPDVAALFGLLVHVVVLFTITAAGGVAFLLHRSHTEKHKSLIEELEQLPTELPQH